MGGENGRRQKRAGRKRSDDSLSSALCFLPTAYCLLLFRFLPERFQLVERSCVKGLIALAQLPFNIIQIVGETLRLVNFKAASGSTFRCRAIFVAANRRSPSFFSDASVISFGV